jgi:hypothetical protein
MTSAIEAYLAKLANELGPRSRGLVAEARDHLLAAAEEMEASGVDRRAAEVAALERFGREHELIASFTRELDEEEEDLMEQSSLRRLTSLLLIAGLALGINVALNSYGSVHATPLRTAVAIGLFAACLVGVRCVLLGTVGVGGAIGLALCALGVMASFDRDGVGFGLGGALFAMGVAYSALGFTLVRRGALAPIVGVGLGMPLLAGGLRAAVHIVGGGADTLPAISAVLLAFFGISAAWLAYKVWPEDLVIGVRSASSDPTAKAPA